MTIRALAILGVLTLSATACGGSNSPSSPDPDPTPTPTTFSLSGTVSDARNGHGISGAIVQIQDGPNAGFRATANGSGQYTFARRGRREADERNAPAGWAGELPFRSRRPESRCDPLRQSLGRCQSAEEGRAPLRPVARQQFSEHDPDASSRRDARPDEPPARTPRRRRA